MKHWVKVRVPVEKNGLFGKKTVLKTRTIEVDDETYKRMRKEWKKRQNRPYTIEEMMLHDDLFF